jgi:hypothetical protein
MDITQEDVARDIALAEAALLAPDTRSDEDVSATSPGTGPQAQIERAKRKLANGELR